MSNLSTERSALFVGRSTELNKLHQFLEEVTNTKQLKVILVQGDFGMGKTALVEHFLDNVAGLNYSVLFWARKMLYGNGT